MLVVPTVDFTDFVAGAKTLDEYAEFDTLRYYNDLKKLLAKAGFKIHRKKYTNYFFPLKSNSRKFYSWSLIVSASKS